MRKMNLILKIIMIIMITMCLILVTGCSQPNPNHMDDFTLDKELDIPTDSKEGTEEENEPINSEDESEETSKGESDLNGSEEVIEKESKQDIKKENNLDELSEIMFDVGDGNAFDEAEKEFKKFYLKQIELEELNDFIWELHGFGDLSLTGLIDLIGNAYYSDLINQEDLRELTVRQFSGYEISFDNLVKIVFVPYQNKQFDEDIIRYLVMNSYKDMLIKKQIARNLLMEGYANYIEQEVLAKVIIDAYNEGDINNEDLHWFTTSAFKTKRMTKEVMHFILIEYGFAKGIIELDELQEFLTEAYDDAEITKENVKWMMTAAYAEGIFTEEELSYKNITN